MRQLTGSRLPRIMPFMSNVECLLLGISTVCNGSTAAYRASQPRHPSIAVQLRKTAEPQRGVRRATVYPALGARQEGFRAAALVGNFAMRARTE